MLQIIHLNGMLSPNLYKKTTRNKSKFLTAFLALILGFLGAHRFYLGQNERAIFYLLLSFTGLPLVLSLFEFPYFLFMGNTYFKLNYINPRYVSCYDCDSLLIKGSVYYVGLPVKYDLCKICFKKRINHYFFSTTTETKFFENRPVPDRFTDLFSMANDARPPHELFKSSNKTEPDSHDTESNTVYIHYKDADGKFSSRLITINSIEPVQRNDYSIRAFCHEKNELRAFRYSRIQQTTDINTGEILPDILQYFSNLNKNTGIAAVLAVFKSLIHEITILSFCSTYNSNWSENKIDQISGFLTKHIQLMLNSSYLEVELRRNTFTKTEFISSVEALTQLPLNYRKTLFALVVELFEEDIESVETNNKLSSFIMHRWNLK